ncbi:MAG: RNA polymerase sigma factor, partial [Nocardioides sp.]
MEGPEVIDIGPAPAAMDAEALLGEVFLRSYRRLVIQLYGVVGDLGEAEDLVQEAFVRAAAAGTRFARVRNHEAWLRTVAIRLHRNRWRTFRNFTRVRSDLVETRELPAEEQHLALVEALRGLPPGQREVLTLHYFADLTVTEIAETLRIREGTVKSRLSRGREA